MESPAAASSGSLRYGRNDVAVVTNVAPDYLGLGGIDTRFGKLGPGQGGHRRGGCRGTGSRCSTGRPVGPPDAPALQRRRHLVLARVPRHRQPRVHRAALPPRRAGRGLEQTFTGMIVIKHGRRTMQLAWTTCCRRPSAAQRRSTSPTRWQPPVRHSPRAPRCTTSAGPADVHDELLPVSRPDEPRQRRQRRGVHRLLPQRGEHARDRRLRRDVHGAELAVVRTSPSPRGSA